jgi:ATP-dependent protease ClpP protease subunit
MNTNGMATCQREDDEDDIETTKVVGNEMFFYGEVTNESILDFIEKFKRLEVSLLKVAADINGYTPEIRIHICSEGGCLFSGFSAMNLLEKSRCKVTTIAQGSCCSAATFMLLGGSSRRIARNAHVLIHQLSSSCWGKYEDMKDEIKQADKLMEMIRDVYTTKTDIPEKKLKKLLKRDYLIEPQQALKYGIVHAYD